MLFCIKFFFSFLWLFFNNLHSDFLFECYIVLFFSLYVGNPCLHSFPLFNLHIDPTSAFSKCVYYAWFKNESCAVLSCSVVSDSLCSWTVARQAPLSMGFSRKEYWSGLPCPPPGDLPDPGIEPRFSTLQADFLLSESLRLYLFQTQPND